MFILHLFELLLDLHTWLDNVTKLVKSFLLGRLCLYDSTLQAGDTKLTPKAEKEQFAAGVTPPRPPATVAIVLAEAQADAIDTWRLAQLLTWCSHKPCLQHVYLYDPAGHIKSQLQELAAAIITLSSSDAAPLQGGSKQLSTALSADQDSQQRQLGTPLFVNNNQQQLLKLPTQPCAQAQTGSTTAHAAGSPEQLHDSSQARPASDRHAVEQGVGTQATVLLPGPEVGMQARRRRLSRAINFEVGWKQEPNTPPQQQQQQQQHRPQHPHPHFVLLPPTFQLGNLPSLQQPDPDFAGQRCMHRASQQPPPLAKEQLSQTSQQPQNSGDYYQMQQLCSGCQCPVAQQTRSAVQACHCEIDASHTHHACNASYANHMHSPSSGSISSGSACALSCGSTSISARTSMSSSSCAHTTTSATDPASAPKQHALCACLHRPAAGTDQVSLSKSWKQHRAGHYSCNGSHICANSHMEHSSSRHQGPGNVQDADSPQEHSSYSKSSEGHEIGTSVLKDQPSLHVRLLSSSDSYTPILAATRRLGSTASTQAASLHSGVAGGTEALRGFVSVGLREDQQRAAGADLRHACHQHDSMVASGMQPSQSREGGEEPVGSTQATEQCQEGAEGSPLSLDPSTLHNFEKLWKCGSSAPCATRLKAPGRTCQQSAAILVHHMVEACGPQVAIDPQLILVYSRGPLTLAGFSPFHTRTAEILGMGPLDKATEFGLEAAFARYATIKQRFGK